MIDLIVQHLHTVTMAAAVGATALMAAFGFRRSTMPDSDETRWGYNRGWLKPTAIVGGILVALTASLPITPRGYEGVIFDVVDGVKQEALAEGINFVVPFKQHVTNVNTQIGIYVHNNENVWQHTKDTQEVRVPIAVNYRTANAPYVYENIRGDIATTIVEPATLRALRTVIGEYELENLAINQATINSKIEDLVQQQLRLHGIEATYIALEDTIMKSGIIEAIEREKVRNRDRLTAEHEVYIAEQEALAAIERAEGEAQAIERVAQAEQERLQRLGMSASEFVWYSRWNGVVPQILLSDGSNVILPIPELTQE